MQPNKKISKVSSVDGEEISVAHSFVMLSRINAHHADKLVDAMNTTNTSHSPVLEKERRRRVPDDQNTPSVH